MLYNLRIEWEKYYRKSQIRMKLKKVKYKSAIKIMNIKNKLVRSSNNKLSHLNHNNKHKKDHLLQVKVQKIGNKYLNNKIKV